jgi:hypothetical protein
MMRFTGQECRGNGGQTPCRHPGGDFRMTRLQWLALLDKALQAMSVQDSKAIIT